MKDHPLRLMGLLIALGLVACEDKPVIPPPPPETQPAPATQPAIPTTQALLTAPRKQLRLTPLPLTIEVPPGWEIQPLGSLIFLQGPAPHGDVRIQLATRPRITEDQLKSLEESAKAFVQQKPETAKLGEVRKIGDMRLIERQSISRATPLKTRDEKGAEVVIPADYQWTLNVFIPDGEKIQNYELNFFNLTVEQYEADKDFLRSIIDSVKREVIPSAL